MDMAEDIGEDIHLCVSEFVLLKKTISLKKTSDLALKVTKP